MHILFTIAASLLITSLSAAAPTTIWQSPYSGEIVQPEAGAVVVPDVDFPFQYDDSNWCESAFSPLTAYLTQGPAPPPFSDVTADGTLAEGSYVANFGEFVISNFGLPLSIVGGVPPPANLSIPLEIAQELDAGTGTYLTVLQQFDSCPGSIAVEYSLASVPLTMSL